MTKMATFLSITCFVLFLALVYSVYRWVDLAISYSYISENQNVTTHTQTLLGNIVKSELIGQDRESVLLKLKQIKNNHPEYKFILKVFEDSNDIEFELLSFKFESNKLVDVKGF